MKVVIYGASGMVGQGVLRECLLDPKIAEVRCVVRSATATAHPRLRELVHANFLDYSSLEAELTGMDACFYCIGIASTGHIHIQIHPGDSFTARVICSASTSAA